MDRQYEYLFVNPSDRHGVLSHDAGQRVDPLAQERIGLNCGFRFVDRGMRNPESNPLRHWIRHCSWFEIWSLEF